MSRTADILKKYDFRYKKELGQNFVTDINLLSAIVADSNAADEAVVEIGAGAGTLTAALAKAARRVCAFEVDYSLKPVLEETLSCLDNVEVIFKDVLKMSDNELLSLINGQRQGTAIENQENDTSLSVRPDAENLPFIVVANLPYYITSPLIMRFLESGLNIKSMTVMVQKEVAERICAAPGSKAYSAFTLAVQYYGRAVITRTVSRKLFYPMPDVDSAIVRIDVDRNRYGLEQPELFLKLIHAAFAMRRKTLINNLGSVIGINKNELERMLEDVGLDKNIRGEALNMYEYLKIYERIINKNPLQKAL